MTPTAYGVAARPTRAAAIKRIIVCQEGPFRVEGLFWFHALPLDLAGSGPYSPRARQHGSVSPVSDLDVIGWSFSDAGSGEYRGERGGRSQPQYESKPLVMDK